MQPSNNLYKNNDEYDYATVANTVKGYNDEEHCDKQGKEGNFALDDSHHNVDHKQPTSAISRALLSAGLNDKQNDNTKKQYVSSKIPINPFDDARHELKDKPRTSLIRRITAEKKNDQKQSALNKKSMQPANNLYRDNDDDDYATVADTVEASDDEQHCAKQGKEGHFALDDSHHNVDHKQPTSAISCVLTSATPSKSQHIDKQKS